MIQVEVLKLSDCWCVRFSTESSVLRAELFERLVDAIEYCSLLGVSITNADQLPINQYRYVSK